MFDLTEPLDIEIKVFPEYRELELPLPTYATDGSNAVDFRAVFTDQSVWTIEPHTTVLIPSGIAVHIKNPNVALVLLPRSSFGHRMGMRLGNTIGLIDSDYQGQIFLSVRNCNDHDVSVQRGERIVQGMFVPIVRARFREVEEFEKSVRGEGGFGHSGRH